MLRLRRKLTRDAVVDALVARLGLDPAKREKVDGYYHELEVGLLDPEPVDRSVWDVLADVLKANVRALAGYVRASSLPARRLPRITREPTLIASATSSSTRALAPAAAARRAARTR